MFGICLILSGLVIGLFLSAWGIWWSIDNSNSYYDLINPIFIFSSVVWIVFIVKVLGTVIKFKGGSRN